MISSHTAACRRFHRVLTPMLTLMVRMVQETVEAQSAELRKLLERCIVAFAVSRKRDADGELLRKSLRALIVVITYVDACRPQDAGAVFETLWTQGVGVGRSLLYEGWAVIRERDKNYEAAAEIFQLGLRNAAKACEETFEATLRKGLRELTQRRRKRGASGGQSAPEAKRVRKRVEKKGYMQNLLATDNGDEMCFEEWRVLEHTLLRAASTQPETSPAQPEASPGNNATMSVDISQLMPSPVASPQPAAPAATRSPHGRLIRSTSEADRVAAESREKNESPRREKRALPQRYVVILQPRPAVDNAQVYS
eukprot:COSAG02_NODE_664_length_18739_cov_11.071567_9_plen_310_part_00